MAMGTVVIAVGQRAPEECLETTRVNVLDNFASDVMWRQCSVNVRVNPESRHSWAKRAEPSPTRSVMARIGRLEP